MKSQVPERKKKTWNKRIEEEEIRREKKVRKVGREKEKQQLLFLTFKAFFFDIMLASPARHM